MWPFLGGRAWPLAFLKRWIVFQPELGECGFARRVAVFEVRRLLHTDLGDWGTLPGSLRSLSFGACFYYGLENVALPGSLLYLSVEVCSSQSLENVALPGSLQSLSFGYEFNESLENVALPGSLQSLSFGASSTIAWSS